MRDVVLALIVDKEEGNLFWFELKTKILLFMGSVCLRGKYWNFYCLVQLFIDSKLGLSFDTFILCKNCLWITKFSIFNFHGSNDDEYYYKIETNCL